MSFKEVDEKESEEEEEEEEELEEKRAPPKPVTKEYVPKVKEGPLLFEVPRGRVVADLKEEDLELIAEKNITPAWKKAGESNQKRVLVINSETASAVFKADGTVEKTEATGLIGFYNPNKKNRVWDIDSYWENLAKTNLAARDGLCHIDIYELEPGEVRAKKYALKEVEASLRLSVSVNTTPGKEKGPNVLIKDKETVAEVMVTATNVSKMKLENITVEKDLGGLGSASDAKAKAGTAKLEGKKVVWSGFSLDPNGAQSMTFKVPMSAKTIDPLKLGDITASYVAPDMTISGIAFMGSDGYTKNVTWIDKDEIDMSPGRWNCAIEFENLSTFEILLREVEVYRQTAEEHIFKKRSDKRQHLIVDEERLDVTLSPDTENKWSKSFVYPDPKEEPVMKLPSFGQKVEFSVKSMFLRELTGSVVQLGGVVTIADMEVEKAYKLKEVSAAERKANITTLKACNTGSAPLDDMTFNETIPPGFDVDPATVKAYIIRSGADRVDITRSIKTTPPREKDLKKERKLTILLENVNKVDTIRAIKPKECVEINYDLLPLSPEPGKEFTSKVDVIGNVLVPFPAGEELRASAEDKIGIKPYVWRKVRVGKSIQEGATKGEYSITIYYKNKMKSGELALVTDDEASLPDIDVKDILPEGFKLVSSSPAVTDQKPRLIEGKSFTVLEWAIQDIRPDQMVEIKYSIKGEPGAVYKTREAQALLTA
ncbi:MAG: hypothetical protein ACFFBV_16860 [Promethearchaeota archaeon]